MKSVIESFPMKNLTQTSFDSIQRTVLLQALGVLGTNLAGARLPALTPEERGRYGAINEQNKLFVNKVRDYQAHSPTLSSPDVNWVEFEKNYQARSFSENMATRLDRLAYQLESAKILHDADNYREALDAYAFTQYQSGASVLGAAEKVADLNNSSIAPSLLNLRHQFREELTR